MDNLSDILEKLRISFTGENISNHDGKLPPDASLIRAVLEAIKEHKGIIFILFNTRKGLLK